jgi:hypothetical protein
MAKAVSTEEAPNIRLHTDEGAPADTTVSAHDPEAPEPEQFEPPARENNDASPIVLAAASTITGCTEAEVKNFIATMDFVSRQMAIKFAGRWKTICKIAKTNSDDGAAPAKSSLGVKIDIDQTNINMMDTKCTFKVKPNSIDDAVDKQENLLQVQFQLS